MAKIDIFLSSKKKHLIFASKYFIDGIEVVGKDKLGILAIENYNQALKILEKAKSMSWELGDEPDEYGFYLVLRKKENVSD